MQKKNNLKQIVFNTVLNKIKFTFFDHVTLYYYRYLHTDYTNKTLILKTTENFKSKEIKKKSDKTSDINPIAIKLFNLKS